MTVGWLIDRLNDCDPKDEVILVIEDIGSNDVSAGILSHIIRDGEGAERGKCELYGKA